MKSRACNVASLLLGMCRNVLVAYIQDFQQPGHSKRLKTAAEKPRKGTGCPLSLKLNRFTMPPEDDRTAKCCEGYTPKNRSKNRAWAVRGFTE